MKTAKKRKLEAAGFRVGTTSELLGLSAEEAALVEMRLSLGKVLVARRKKLGWSQTQVAKSIGSSQSRVAKMEAGEPSVSVDLLIRTLLKLGVSAKRVGKAIGSVELVA